MSNLRNICKILWILLLIDTTFLTVTVSLIADTEQGEIAGTVVEFVAETPVNVHRNVCAFLGIPYAEPPVGPLRFKPPVAKAPWKGSVFKATKYGNICPQPIDATLLVPKPDVPQDEDCLYLNVYVPEPEPDRLLPVMVFIHGGAFVVGATWPDNIPISLASIGDVIVVDIQYRLGALGFLATGDEALPGNLALLDQLEALRWVQRNIEDFQGDPDKVTIFGQSAGSSSVSFHLLSPMSRGLFKYAIMQSGTSNTVWSFTSHAEARKRAFALGHLVGCDTHDNDTNTLAQCLRQVSAQDIVDNQAEKLFAHLGEVPQIAFVSVIDDRFLLDAPETLIKNGAINDANIMIGTTRDEGMLMMSMVFRNHAQFDPPHVDRGLYERLLPMTISGLGSMDPLLLQSVRLVYTHDIESGNPNAQYLHSLSDSVGDSGFTCPTDRLAMAAASQPGRKVYRYSFTHHPYQSFFGLKWTRSCHGDDLIYVFGLPFVSPRKENSPEEERILSATVIKYWSNFAKTGDPNLNLDGVAEKNHLSLASWPRFTHPLLEYKDLSLSMRNGLGGIRTRECEFWGSFVPELIKSLGDGITETSSRNGITPISQEDTCTKDTCP